MKRALVSVSDKTGLVEFVQGLVDCGYEIISTGGTKKALEAAGIHPIGISDVTGFPEIMDGRVKTYIQKFMVHYFVFVQTQIMYVNYKN